MKVNTSLIISRLNQVRVSTLYTAKLNTVYKYNYFLLMLTWSVKNSDNGESFVFSTLDLHVILGNCFYVDSYYSILPNKEMTILNRELKIETDCQLTFEWFCIMVVGGGASIAPSPPSYSPAFLIKTNVALTGGITINSLILVPRLDWCRCKVVKKPVKGLIFCFLSCKAQFSSVIVSQFRKCERLSIYLWRYCVPLEVLEIID